MNGKWSLFALGGVLAVLRRCGRPFLFTIYHSRLPILRLLAMVGVALQNRPGAVDLLDEQHAGQSVWQGQTRQPDTQASAVLDRFGEAIRAAYEHGDIGGRILPVPEFFGQAHGRQVFAMFITHHAGRALGGGRLDARRLGAQQLWNAFAGTARFGSDFDQGKSEISRQALGVIGECRVDPAGHLVSDCDDGEFHFLRGLAFLGAALRFFVAAAVVGRVGRAGLDLATFGLAGALGAALRAFAAGWSHNSSRL